MKAIKKLLPLAITMGIGIYFGCKMMKRSKADETQKIRADKNASVIATLNYLFMIVQNQKNIAEYLKQQGVSSVAIYGMGNVGSRLYDELKNSDIEVLYGIDGKAEKYMEGLNIITIEEIVNEPDLIIVTPVYYFDEIVDDLQKKVNCPILSIEDILNNM